MEDRGELKVVLHLKGDQALVGVQEKGTDPVVERHVGDLVAVLSVIPEVVERARQRWTTSPRNPAYQGPPPPPPQPVPRAQPAGQPREAEQQRFF